MLQNLLLQLASSRSLQNTCMALFLHFCLVCLRANFFVVLNIPPSIWANFIVYIYLLIRIELPYLHLLWWWPSSQLNHVKVSSFKFTTCTPLAFYSLSICSRRTKNFAWKFLPYWSGPTNWGGFRPLALHLFSFPFYHFISSLVVAGKYPQPHIQPCWQCVKDLHFAIPFLHVMESIIPLF